MVRLVENPVIEKPQLQQVYNFAKTKHDETGAVRKFSGEPYFVHPSMVADICLAYGGTDEEVALALLHDTVEDTSVTYEDIISLYGENVAELLSEITNDPTAIASLGKENYINQELLGLEHPALFVKLCDCYANLLDNPTPAQKDRLIRNLSYLIDNRGDDLTDKERRLLKSIPELEAIYDLDKSEFDQVLDIDSFEDGSPLYF